MHIRNLKRALNQELILKKIHKVIKSNQKVWLKSCIDMNIELTKKSKNDFENFFFKLMNNSVFEKTIENARKHRDINLVTMQKRRNYQVSEHNYHSTNFFSKSLLAVKMKKVYDQVRLFRFINTRNKKNCNV